MPLKVYIYVVFDIQLKLNTSNGGIKIMMTDKEKLAAAQYIATNTPEKILEQFVKITELYNINQENLLKDLNNKDRFDSKLYYINQTYNIINVLIKLIAITSSETNGLDRLTPQHHEEEKPQQQSIKEIKHKEEPNKSESTDMFDDMVAVEIPEANTDVENTSNEEDDISVEDVIIEEINSWGIKPNTFTHRVFLELLNIVPTDDIKSNGLSYNYAIGIIASNLNKGKNVVASAISNAIRKAKFENSKHIPVLRSMDRDKITKEFVIKQLYDFILSEY